MNITDKKNPLKIIYHDEILGLTDDILLKDGILYFLFMGWIESDGYPQTGNPFHFLKGDITGKGPWFIADHEFWVLTPDDEWWYFYQNWLKTKKDRGITNEKAKEILERIIGETDA